MLTDVTAPSVQRACVTIASGPADSAVRRGTTLVYLIIILLGEKEGLVSLVGGVRVIDHEGHVFEDNVWKSCAITSCDSIMFLFFFNNRLLILYMKSDDEVTYVYEVWAVFSVY